MKRDAQLTLRIPARLKEEIRDRAAKENRKPADAAVRILETNLDAAELVDAAKEALDVMPVGDKKDRLVLAILRQIGNVALMLLLVWNGRSFGVSPDACVAMCKIMNQSKGGVTCSIYYVERAGGVLFLDFQTKTVKDVSPRTTLQWEGLRDAFIATGGWVEMTERSHNAPYRCGSVGSSPA